MCYNINLSKYCELCFLPSSMILSVFPPFADLIVGFLSRLVVFLLFSSTRLITLFSSSDHLKSIGPKPFYFPLAVITFLLIPVANPLGFPSLYLVIQVVIHRPESQPPSATLEVVWGGQKSRKRAKINFQWKISFKQIRSMTIRWLESWSCTNFSIEKIYRSMSPIQFIDPIKDTWCKNNISITHRRKHSTGQVMRTRETWVHKMI